MKFVQALSVIGTFVLATPALPQGTQVALSGQEQDPDAPVEITSTTLSVDRETGIARFEGDVVVVQGLLRLTSDEVLVSYLEDRDSGETQVEEIIATGNVVVVNGEEAAEGDQAVYDPISRTVEMTGDVLLTQGPSTIAGEVLVIDLTTCQGTMQGRVRTVFQPGASE